MHASVGFSESRCFEVLPQRIGSGFAQALQQPLPGRRLAGKECGVSEFLKFFLGEETAVGQPGALTLQIDDALNL
jgi:hypothetical protein